MYWRKEKDDDYGGGDSGRSDQCSGDGGKCGTTAACLAALMSNKARYLFFAFTNNFFLFK
jgi:hypothetical protein